MAGMNRKEIEGRLSQMPESLRPDQAGELFGRSGRTIVRWCRDNKLPLQKMGRHGWVRVPRQSVLRIWDLLYS